jgi:hypothetical protein
MLFLLCGILLIDAGRYRSLIAWVFLACFNRESIVMVVAIAALAWRPALGWAKAVGRSLPVFAAWVAAKLLLWYAYRDRSGDYSQFWAVEDHTGQVKSRLAMNIDALAQWQAWLIVAPILGYVWLLVLIGGRRVGDPVLRAALVSFPPFALLLLWAGVVVEIRIFAEYIPVFAVAAVAIVARSAGETGRAIP